MDLDICKHCSSKLEVREVKKNPAQQKKSYYYTHYYLCPNCHRLYHSDKFKVINPQTMAFHFTPHKKKKEETIVSDGTYDVRIWTDGACVFNGTPKAKAAWAFVAGDVEKAGRLIGKQTNNRAEGLAIFNALKWAGESGYKTVQLSTDSQISLHNLKKDPRMVKMNADIFYDIADIIQTYDLQVSYVKVLGHSGDINNERVDKLANGTAVNQA